MTEFSCQSCIRGYHIYMECWGAPLEEELVCKPQENNSSDSYTVIVLTMCEDKIVGHLPRKISRICWLLQCTVEGPRWYSADLSQGGMEIPIKLKVIGNETEIRYTNCYKWHQLVVVLPALC